MLFASKVSCPQSLTSQLAKVCLFCFLVYNGSHILFSFRVLCEFNTNFFTAKKKDKQETIHRKRY